MVAVITAHPQDPVLQAPTLQKVLELTLHVRGQGATLGG